MLLKPMWDIPYARFSTRSETLPALVAELDPAIMTQEGIKGKGVCLTVYRADSKARTQLAVLPIHPNHHNAERTYAGGRVVSVSPRDGEVVCVDLGAKKP